MQKGCLQQIHSTRALDLADKPAMDGGGHTGGAAGDDLAGLRAELSEELGVLEADLVGTEIHATAWHLAVRLAEGDEAFLGLGLHVGKRAPGGGGRLADFAVKGVALE